MFDKNLFKNRYKINSTRLKHWDYSNDGYYFVTICTKDRINYFGQIKNDEMILNKYGEIIKRCWQKIPNHFLNTKLDEYIVMPNHIHGIIIINNHKCRDVACNVSTMAKISPKSNSLSTIVRSFKSACAKRIHEYDLAFAWQARFYDRIIRNERELYNVRKYIKNNPQKWGLDRNNLEK